MKKQPKPVMAWAGLDCPQSVFDSDHRDGTNLASDYREPFNIYWTKAEALRCYPPGEVIRVRIVPVQPKRRAKP